MIKKIASETTVKKGALFTILIVVLLLVSCRSQKGETCRDGEVTMSVSAYSLVGKTASGLPSLPGTCACGLSYPFGTRFDVPGLGMVICQDHGAAVTDKHLDIWLPSQTLARTWGRKELLVKVHCP